MGKQPQIGGRFVGACRDAGQTIEHLRINLTRIGLPGDGVAFGKAHLLRDAAFELPHFGVVAVEEF